MIEINTKIYCIASCATLPMNAKVVDSTSFQAKMATKDDRAFKMK